MIFWRKKKTANQKVPPLQTGKDIKINKVYHINVKDVQSIAIEYSDQHYEIVLKNKAIKYRNVISPRDGGRKFPDGYFDERMVLLSADDFDNVIDVTSFLIQKHGLERTFSILPCGVSHEAYMRVVLNETELYYTDTHAVDDGCRIKKDPIAEEFYHIVSILSKYCECSSLVSVGEPILYSNDVMEHLAGDLVSRDCIQVIGYRYAETGVWGYVFYENQTKICTVSIFGGISTQVFICGEGKVWKSDFDINFTIVPGMTRKIVEQATGQIIARVTYNQPGKCIINESIHVYYDAFNFKFYCDDILVAILKCLNTKNDLMLESDKYEMQAYYEIAAVSGMNDELMLLIAGFPMICF